MRPQAFADVIAPYNARNVSLDKFAPVAAPLLKPAVLNLVGPTAADTDLQAAACRR